MGRKKTAVIRIDEQAKKRLDVARKYTDRSYTDLILQYTPPSEDFWKDELFNHINALIKLFPEKREILEFIRYIILYSEELPQSSRIECDELVKSTLNDLSHRVLASRERVLKNNRTEKGLPRQNVTKMLHKTEAVGE